MQCKWICTFWIYITNYLKKLEWLNSDESLCIFILILVTIEITRRDEVGPDPFLYCMKGDNYTSALSMMIPQKRWRVEPWTAAILAFEEVREREDEGLLPVHPYLILTIKCTPKSPKPLHFSFYRLLMSTPTLSFSSTLDSFVFTSF